MNLVQEIEHWGDDWHSRFTDIIRICLGLFIIMKGVLVINSRDAIYDLLYNNDTFAFSGLLLAAIIHYVVFAHIVGGIFLAIGLLTRFAAVIQIPVLLGAIFFVNIAKGFTALNSELWLSVLVFLMLLMFWVIGSGPLSVDHHLKRSNKADLQS